MLCFLDTPNLGKDDSFTTGIQNLVDEAPIELWCPDQGTDTGRVCAFDHVADGRYVKCTVLTVNNDVVKTVPSEHTDGSRVPQFVYERAPYRLAGIQSLTQLVNQLHCDII